MAATVSVARLCLRPALARCLVPRACLATRNLSCLGVKAQDAAWLTVPNVAPSCTRLMSGMEPLDLKSIHERVMLVLNLFDKVDNAKLTPESHFVKDLGLDSLDQVEIILQMEDEFGFEIPDDHGETLWTAKAIAEYVADHQDIYE